MAGVAALDRGEVPLDREPRRILRPAVFVALVLAELVLDVGRRLVDRRDDGAGRGIGFLSGVQADRTEARVPSQLHERTTIHLLISRSPRTCLDYDRAGPFHHPLEIADMACSTRC